MKVNKIVSYFQKTGGLLQVLARIRNQSIRTLQYLAQPPFFHIPTVDRKPPTSQKCGSPLVQYLQSLQLLYGLTTTLKEEDNQYNP